MTKPAITGPAASGLCVFAESVEAMLQVLEQSGDIVHAASIFNRELQMLGGTEREAFAKVAGWWIATALDKCPDTHAFIRMPLKAEPQLKLIK